MKVEFYFDFSSPWSFLAFSQMENLVQRLKNDHRVEVEVEYKPILVGAVFNQVNMSVFEFRESYTISPKTKYLSQDLNDWSAAYGLKIMNPYDLDLSKRVNPFPVNSIKALRGAHFFKKLGKEKFMKYCWTVFRTYWSESKDINEDTVMKEIVSSLGENVEEFMKFISTKEIKERIRTDVQSCIDRGGFGVPTFFINGKMFFGNDRLPLVEREILLQSGKSKL